MVPASRRPTEERLVEAGALRMRVSPEGETGLIQLYGEFDLASAEAVDRELRRSEESVAGTVVVDLSGLDFIDSSGIAVLAHAADRASKNESRFGLRRGNAQVERTFELAGLSELLPFLD